MNKILIVLNDSILISIFKSWVFRSQKKETLFFAKNAKEAIEVMNAHSIDLLVTELDLSELDGLELVSGASVYHPTIKIAFFLPTNTSTIVSEKLKKLTSIYFIDKPNSLKDFIQFVNIIEETEFMALPMVNINITDILQLIECQKKTCLVAIENEANQQKGFVYFEQGILYDAKFADFKAELAVVEILTWKHARLSFKPITQKKFLRHIQYSLDTLINDGSNLKSKAVEDEQADAQAKAALQEQADAKAKAALQEQADAKAKAALQEQADAKADAALQEQADAKAKAALQEQADAKAKAALQEQADTKAKAALQEQADTKAKAALQEQADAKALQALFIKINSLDLEDTLQPLQEMDDYLASTIFDMAGRVVIKHQVSSFEHNMDDISLKAIDIIKTALETVSNGELGKFNFIQVNAEQGIFEAVWVLENQFVGAVLLKAEAKNTGLAKIRLIKIGESIRSKLL